ncbi:tetratricopeptide repeat protein [Pectobacterium parmentieri]|uniref:Tetratricopeptide repeat protein n=1 Tax=Pectobacterium parmentieri TaxID=1905730 RepID=A0A0H3I7H1_PECPM|nr:tetratricopeptide repeat protein [Pectobacterium parmentieri]ACX88448.1 conserved hypothetical protein [Pectobacterium parmentieri WPP163]AFI90759.1 Hypothetical protein W5S_2673 [Pectobacterium parmentieri]AYH06139.1 tetratricopeptide repeat-containing protein [Pectobacterium parmentieri]AYH14955.1 tetratricopeptide repeat-containing protein [Pectobacterium parmentieri]AYH23656.1 tetratricopeptide repeat-containing protein [Pectobacterium parmentieri]
MSEINSFIADKIEAGTQLNAQGKKDEALSIYLSIWVELDDLYDDKYQREETRWLIRCIYNNHFSQGNYQEARKWAEEMFKCDIPSYSTAELIDLGKVFFELGDEEHALLNFSKAYAIGKKRAFQGRDPKYLKFFLSNKT